ncbi:MAG TPA: helix-turn-helix transcriptional regulator, partial [Gemmatimonadales bacterium]|nr:helix-turn-helix transcriptional regulator [Gemmatimonadales bacterium]
VFALPFVKIDHVFRELSSPGLLPTMLAMKTKERGPMGSVLLDRRERCGYTQDELARRAGLDTSSIGAYERGERKPKGEKLARVCVALGLEPEAFFEEVAQAEAQALKPLMDKVRKDMGEVAPSTTGDPDLEPYRQAWEVCSGVWRDAFLLAARLSRLGDPKGAGGLDSLVQFFTKVNQTIPVNPGEPKPPGSQEPG